MKLLVAALALLLLVGTGFALAADEDGGEATSSSPAGSTSLSPAGEEIPAERTATSRTYELPNGSRVTKLFELPVNYRDDDGQWKPIEEGLERTQSGALVNGDNSFDLRLPAHIGGGPVRLSVGEEWISQELLGATGGAAELQEEAASYDAAQPATSFSFSTLANGLKEDIEIAGPAAPSTFRFSLDASAGLAPVLRADGSVDFEDAAGKIVATLPAPVMYDSSAAASTSEDVRYTLSPKTEAGTWTLSVEADRNWLEQPERAWPVVIDPSILKGGTEAGCSLASGPYETTSYCSASGWPTLSAWAKYQWYATGEEQYQRALVNFNLSSIPTDAYVSSATLGLYAPSEAQETSGAQVRRVTSAWNASTASWKYAYCAPGCVAWKSPGGDWTGEGPEILTSERGSEPGWWTFSQGLTPLVQSWVANATLRAGLLVKLKDEKPYECSSSCPERAIDWNSSAAAEASTRPYLSVTYWPHVPATANAKVVSPVDGTKTAKRLKLQASWTSGITSITWLYREGKTGFFKEIPAAAVRDGEGKAISWPVSAGSSPSKPLFLDATQLSPTLRKNGGSLQVRPLFEGGKEGVGTPVETTVDPALGGPKDATTQVGPGSVDLLTGNFTVTKTDVSIPTFNSALDFSRTFSSRDAATPGSTGLMGPGWKLGVPVEENGAGEWSSIKFSKEPESFEGEPHSFEWATAIGVDGAEIPFELEGGAYKTPDELPGWSLTKPNASQYVLLTPDGTKTTFDNISSPNPAEYLPIEVSQVGSSTNSTRMAYAVVNGNRRLTQIVAPAAPGISCVSNPTATAGCKTLVFNYATWVQWGGSEAKYGDRLSSISYYAPGFGGPWTVADYLYNGQGRLIAAKDPRITPYLTETYTYNTDGQIATITPPGVKPWKMNYGTLNQEKVSGRLLSVERDSLVAGMAKTTIAYGVPLSGSGLPGLPSMSPADVAEWGQADAPLDATAVFPPDQEPASPPTDYSRATIYYMDGDGYAVNTATPAGGGTGKPSISTSETDRYGNVMRELTPQNRVRALAKGNVEERKALSHKLETRWVYEDEGTEMVEEFGPVHPVRIQEGALAGQVVEAQLYRHVDYDQVPEGVTLPTPPPHLPTTEKTAAMLPSNGSLHDERINKTEYGDWKLRKPTKTIVDAQTGGLNIESVTVYDSNTGLPTETRQPSDAKSAGAGSTKITYYTYKAGQKLAVCETGSKAYVGLPCMMEPAAQPGTAGQPEVKVTKIAAYNQLGQPTEVWEAPGLAALEAGTPRRTTLTGYDSAGRPLTVKRTGGGTAVPTVKTEYSSTTGLPTTQKFDCASGGCEESDDQALTTAYDALGRALQYKDADGQTSRVSYDLLGRPDWTNDGKGTQTRTYDATSGQLTKLEDSAAGTFTASYDADGNLIAEGLPNGLVAESTYDEAGQLTGLAYDKAGSKWLDFDAERSINGQILSQKSLTSRQQYSYDKAGRLVKTNDWDAAIGGNCTTREYVFGTLEGESEASKLAGKNSNRTKMFTRSPGISGACASTGGSEQKYTYDGADRLTGEGIGYDDFGRTTSLPGVFAGNNKTLTTSYFSTDMVSKQTQDGVTNTFQLDASLRQRQRTQGGGLEGVEVFHYAGGTDTPAWTQLGSKWSRNISGISGGIGAIQDSSAGTLLQLTNLHGDIVATATLSPSATKPVSTSEQDEFGVPKLGGTQQFGWLGAKGRRTEFASGVIQMGARSYVPTLGRFISVDPILGGSASAYDYANADPVNGLDLTGLWAIKKAWWNMNARERKAVKRLRHARSALSSSLKHLRKLVKAEGSGGREKLFDPTSGIDLPVPTTIGEFLSTVGDGIKQVDEKTSCTSGGVAGGSAGQLLERSAGKIGTVSARVGQAASKVGKLMSGWGAAAAFAGWVGIC